jgi:hypothetical protein
VTARSFLTIVIGALALLGAGFGAYYFLVKGKGDGSKPADPAAFAGEDVEDSLAVEAGEEATDALGDDSGVEGDPWLDPEIGEGAEGSGDFVDEPFEDVYDPAAAGAEPAKEPPPQSATEEEPAPAEETPTAAEEGAPPEPEAPAEPQ